MQRLKRSLSVAVICAVVAAMILPLTASAVSLPRPTQEIGTAISIKRVGDQVCTTETALDGASHTSCKPVSTPSGGGLTYKLSDELQAASDGDCSKLPGNPKPYVDCLPVPFINQYPDGWTRTQDCGPASAAMVLQHYNLRPKDTSNFDFITQIRQSTTGNLNDEDFTFPQLKKALSDKGLRPAEIDRNQSVDEAMNKIGAAVDSAHLPVIALVHGEDLGRGSRYADHFVVVRGMSLDMKTVYLNDTDTQEPKLPGWRRGGVIALETSIFKQALSHRAEGNANAPYGILITR